MKCLLPQQCIICTASVDLLKTAIDVQTLQTLQTLQTVTIICHIITILLDRQFDYVDVLWGGCLGH